VEKWSGWKSVGVTALSPSERTDFIEFNFVRQQLSGRKVGRLLRSRVTANSPIHLQGASSGDQELSFSVAIKGLKFQVGHELKIRDLGLYQDIHVDTTRFVHFPFLKVKRNDCPLPKVFKSM
jgi:hypothetical protein